MGKGPPAKSDAHRLFQRRKRDSLFRLAYLRNGEDDGGRAHAIRTLHRLYRRQLARWRLVVEASSLVAFADEQGLLPLWSSPIRPSSREARAAIIDRQLEDLFDGIGLRVVRSKDPVAAAKQLFEPKRKPGSRIKYDDRDFDIAVTIERKLWVWVWVWVWRKRRLRLRLDREKGKTLEEAIAEVASVEELEESRVRKIYYAQRKKHTELGIIVEASFVEEQAGFPPKPTSVRRSLRSGARIKIR
jgi:hypothetical protein